MQIYTKFANFAIGYIFYILQYFKAELCNFTKHRMLFQAVVIFLPILNVFKFHVKGERSIKRKLSNTFLQLDLPFFLELELATLAIASNQYDMTLKCCFDRYIYI